MVLAPVTRRVLSVLAAAALVSACANDLYPMPAGPPGARQNNPARVGEPTRAVLIFLAVRPGDRIELLGAEPIGVFDDASVRFLLSRPVVDDSGDSVIGKVSEQLEGAEVLGVASPSRAFDNTVGIVAELTAQRPGRYEVSSVRLRYRLNGGDERVGEGTEVVWTVCADDPAPADCPEAPG